MTVRIKKIALIIFTAVVFAGCNGNSAASKSDDFAKPLPNEMTFKRSLLEKIPPTDALPLKLEKSFTSGDGEVFVYPISLTVADDNQIYVSDNNGQAIYKISADLTTTAKISKEKSARDEENLKYPNTIRFYQNKIFIADNDGIKIFKPNGEFEKLIRSYYSTNDFSIDPKGNFFINANFLTPEQENFLAIKLNENGAKVKGFGQRPNPLENNNIEGKAFIDIEGQNLIVEYKHFPLVQIFDIKSGDLIREFEIKHPVFEGLKNLKNNKDFVNPRTGAVVLPRYFAGMKVVDDRIYLLLYLPNPEIVEVDFQGKELGRYRSDAVTAMNYFGFDVRSVGGARQFIVGLIEPSRSPTIAAFWLNAETQITK